MGHNPPKESVLDYPWELYDLRNDWTQYEDVAAKYPDKLKELQDAILERSGQISGQAPRRDNGCRGSSRRVRA